jgi:hypothetical protein
VKDVKKMGVLGIALGTPNSAAYSNQLRDKLCGDAKLRERMLKESQEWSRDCPFCRI